MAGALLIHRVEGRPDDKDDGTVPAGQLPRSRQDHIPDNWLPCQPGEPARPSWRPWKAPEAFALGLTLACT